MWRRAGEELITHRQAGEQQTDATRARLSRAQPGRREESAGGRRKVDEATLAEQSVMKNVRKFQLSE